MAKIRIDVLITTAASFVDDAGYDALSVSAIAGELDVAPSALYTHCEGLKGLRSLVAAAASENLVDRIRTAAIGTAGDSAVVAMGLAYRRFALDHPGQFAALLRARSSDEPDLRSTNQTVVEVFTLVFTAMGLSPRQSTLAARSTHSAIHGFVALEHVSGTGGDHESEYLYLLRTLQRVAEPEN
ncbi:MAG: TetR/AcrR family transcriptional regulator [Acidimicrobiia bacterium]|nr:TetR/AcrR family transcriptional regulator [Acidimicrobiia bacterium]